MSDQLLKRLVGALVVLIAVWVMMTVLGGRGRGSIAPAGAMAGFFDDVDGAALARLNAQGPEIGLELAPGDDGWTVNGHRADPTMVASFLAAVTDAGIGDLAATNPDNHERMGVSDGRATTLTFETDAGARTLLLGDNGSRYQTSYVRLPGEDEVYLLEGGLGAQLRRPVEQWRDLTMLEVDTATVARLVVERPEGAYTLVRTDAAWTFLEGGDAAPTSVSAILAELSELIATGFLEEADSVARLDREATTRAFDSGGAMLAEVVVGEGETDRWSRTSRDDVIYRLSVFRAQRLAPTRAEVAGEGS